MAQIRNLPAEQLTVFISLSRALMLESMLYQPTTLFAPTAVGKELDS
jgi:hypothetical protein